MDNKFVVHPNKKPFGKTSVISARLPDETIRRLDEVAQKTGRSRNELMMMCVEYALENLEIPEE